MSAIAGLLHRDGSPADLDAITAMLDVMAYRSPHGRGTWSGQDVALGLGLLKTVPEARPEVMVADEGTLAITADVRLDNRSELMAALGLESPDLADGEVILAAYRRWGLSCPEHLLGDFAFAIWDGETRQLFCARDHFGVKPFYYRNTATELTFATEIKALALSPGAAADLDELTLVDLLSGAPPAVDATLYSDILRLPAGHRMVVDAQGVKVESYWTLAPAPTPSGDVVAQFRHHFFEAVRCRMRSAGPVAACLSGGLDSSSVASVAERLNPADQPPLTTLSLVYDETPEMSERPHIEAVLAGRRLDPIFIQGNHVSPLGPLDDPRVEREDLLLAQGSGSSQPLVEAAVARGVRVLLDGHGGDESVSYGWGRLHELAVQRRWIKLWTEFKGIAPSYGQEPWPLFWSYFQRYLPAPLRPLRAASWGLKRFLRGQKPVQAAPAPEEDELVAAELAARTHLTERRASRETKLADPRHAQLEMHLKSLSPLQQSYALEVLDRSYARFGAEARYPFLDRRLVEFSLAAPSHTKQDSGWSRKIMRDAMEGILPPSVQWRRDKLNFMPHLIQGVLDQHRAKLDGLLVADRIGIGGYLDLKTVQGAYGRMTAAGGNTSANDFVTVWRATIFASWLEQVKIRRG